MEEHSGEITLVIVSPVKNESLRIERLADSLHSNQCTFQIIWIVVDDSSSDDTLKVIGNLKKNGPNVLLHAHTSGKIIDGGAYKSWNVGVDYAIANLSEFTHLMKLDADVELDKSYFEKLERHMRNPDIGIVGGILQNSNREQTIHVPGPVKLYSKNCLLSLSDLPLATGYDVMDEILARKNGYEVKVEAKATFKISRGIGNSQGLLHGRRRNGMVCRWTGYYKPYFLLHVIRYFFRKPFFVGSLAMLYGYIFAPPSPYSSELMGLHARFQRKILRKISKNPIKTISNLYSR